MPPANNRSVGVHFNYKIKHENAVWWFRTGGWLVFHRRSIITYTQHTHTSTRWQIKVELVCLEKYGVNSELYVLHTNTVMWLFNIFHLDKFVRRSFIRQCIPRVCGVWSRVSGQKLGIQFKRFKENAVKRTIRWHACVARAIVIVLIANSSRTLPSAPLISNYLPISFSHSPPMWRLVAYEMNFIIFNFWYSIFGSSSNVSTLYLSGLGAGACGPRLIHKCFWNKRRWCQTCPRRTETHRWMWIWKHLDQFTILIAHQFRRISMCALCSLPVTLHK